MCHSSSGYVHICYVISKTWLRPYIKTNEFAAVFWYMFWSENKNEMDLAFLFILTVYFIKHNVISIFLKKNVLFTYIRVDVERKFREFLGHYENYQIFRSKIMHMKKSVWGLGFRKIHEVPEFFWIVEKFLILKIKVTANFRENILIKLIRNLFDGKNTQR